MKWASSWQEDQISPHLISKQLHHLNSKVINLEVRLMTMKYKSYREWAKNKIPTSLYSWKRRLRLLARITPVLAIKTISAPLTETTGMREYLLTTGLKKSQRPAGRRSHNWEGRILSKERWPATSTRTTPKRPTGSSRDCATSWAWRRSTTRETTPT